MLKNLEHIVEKNSQRLGCKLTCHLMTFDKKNSPMEQRKKLRRFLLHELEKRNPALLKKTPANLKSTIPGASDQKGIFSQEQKKILLKPGIPPKTSFASISLSHSTFMGGFIIAPFRQSIGFDLEQWGRASEKTVLRISHKEELNRAPSSSALWSAKESAYKSFGQYPNTPKISIKQIFVFHWRLLPYQEREEYLKNFVSLLKKTTHQKYALEIYDYKFKVTQTNHTGSSIAKHPKYPPSYKDLSAGNENSQSGKGYVCCFKLKELKTDPSSNDCILKRKQTHTGVITSDPYNNKVIAFALLS